MKIPKKVTVAGVVLRVEWADMEGKWGDYDNDKHLIRLSKSLKKEKPDMAVATLLHEMVHASLRLTGVSEVLGDDNEEAVAVNIECIYLPAVEKLLVDRD